MLYLSSKEFHVISEEKRLTSKVSLALIVTFFVVRHVQPDKLLELTCKNPLFTKNPEDWLRVLGSGVLVSSKDSVLCDCVI